MKKILKKDAEGEGPRRLTLSRETIQLLNHPGLSGVIGYGEGDPGATSSTFCLCPTSGDTP